MGSIEAAFQELYPRGVRLAYRILGDLAAAEDVAAEALTRAIADWERVGTLPYRDAWVLRVATNLALDAARRPAPPAQPAPDVEFEESVAVRMALAGALRALPDRQREAIVLRYLAGMTQPEVARALGVSVGTVATHVHRGMRTLRTRLKETGMKVGTIEEAKALVGTGRLVTATVTERVEGRGNADIGTPAWLIRAPRDIKAGEDVEVEVVGVTEDARVVVAVPESPAELERKRGAVGAMQEGDRLRGRVSSIVRFGAFVDVGEQVYGLAHVSELGGRSLESLSVGEDVTVEVLATDVERARIAFKLVS